MQTGNNNMDKKLRQLENQSLPDLSRQDQHWQAMRQMLHEAPPANGKPNSWLRKWGIWMVAAGVSLALVLFFIIPRPQRQEDSRVQTPAIAPASDKTLPAFDTLPAPDITQKDNNTFSLPAGNRVRGSVPAVTHVSTYVWKDTSTTTVTNQPVDSKKETVTLAGFFNKLEKQAQEFLINPLQDTLLHGQDGTALYIPAGTFNSSRPVRLLMKEYYSYQDIITNKLSTCSDGRQLVTGGMLHLMAFAEGNEVGLRPGRSLRWYVPDTSAEMQSMQLFTGQVRERPAESREEEGLFAGQTEEVNWISQERFFGLDDFRPMVRVLDLSNQPYHTRASSRGLVGYFLISQESELNRAELKLVLMDKYGYAKVVLKKEKERHRLTRFRRLFGGRDKWVEKEGLGDSTWMDMSVARIYRLAASDTSKPSNRTTPRYSLWAAPMPRTRAAVDTMAKPGFMASLEKRFSVEISTLGWINCDRFYNDNREKIPYYVDLGDTAANYYTILVFDRIKSMMTGYVGGNRVMFSNVPKGEPARVISVGIKDGKAIAAMEKVNLSTTPLTGLQFEETSPASFREQAAMTDK